MCCVFGPAFGCAGDAKMTRPFYMCMLQTLANPGPNSRFVLKANHKPLVSKSNRQQVYSHEKRCA